MQYLKDYREFINESAPVLVYVNDDNYMDQVSKHCAQHQVTRAEIDAHTATINGVVDEYHTKIREQVVKEAEGAFAKKILGYIDQLKPTLYAITKSRVYAQFLGTPYDDRKNQETIYSFLMGKINAELSNPVYSMAASASITKKNFPEIKKEIEKVAFQLRAKYLQMIRLSVNEVRAKIVTGLPSCTGVVLVDRYDPKFKRSPKPELASKSQGVVMDEAGAAYSNFLNAVYTKLATYA